jgi:acetyl-CoA synthase
MSGLTDLIYSGSNKVLALAEGALEGALSRHGGQAKVAFPSTAYFLPAIYAATGIKAASLADLQECINVQKSLISGKADLGEALNAGLATAIGAEIVEALKYLGESDPYSSEGGVGFVPDAAIRALGVPLVTGDIPGVAVVVGESADPSAACGIVKEYQSSGLLTFLVGNSIDQCLEGGVKMGLDYRVVPLGHDVTAVIHAVTVAIRAALIFGNVEPGSLSALLAYTSSRVPAFVNALGSLSDVVVSAGAGAIALGFPVIADSDIGDLAVAGALESETDPAQIPSRSMKLRNVKAKAKAVDLPVGFAAAFEGEIVRRGAMHAEFNGERAATFELLQMREESEIEDRRITLDGPDIDGDAPVELSLGTLVEVCGQKMQKDFESVIERKFHSWINRIEGVMHTGQRNIFRIRVSKDAYEKGLRLKDLGEALYAMVMEEFSSVVDKCQVTLITQEAKVRQTLEQVAMPAYEARDSRLANLSDESVDAFYTCILCQSFAPSHCCVVTPERLGLCGAVSWLDAKATKELQPAGPCQPIEKKGLLNEATGHYTEVDRIVQEATHGALEHVTLYSIMEDPMTSCGCFECICGVEPASNGVLVVNREYQGATPIGMSFGELASMTGGGAQTPGFMGHGRHFIASKKFMKAEGGVARIVWMPKELKEDVRARLDKTAKELYGIDGFTDMIADETIASDEEALAGFLARKGHPALRMDALL